MNYLVIDTETTGLDYKENGIIEIAYIISNPETKEILHKGNIVMNPGYKKKIAIKALETNGYKLEDFKGFISAKEATLKFYNDIRVHMDGDKFKVVGFNVQFDIKFLQELFDLYLPYTYYKTFDYKTLDPFEVIKIYQHFGIIDTGKSQNLESCAKYYSIPHIPHNCISDVEATYKLWNIVEESIKACHERTDDTEEHN